MSAFKLWLARKLAPEVFRDAEKFDYLRRRLDDLSTWCGVEFPLVQKAVEWATGATRVHFMPLAEYHSLVESKQYGPLMVGSIDRFRERLRQERDATPLPDKAPEETSERRTGEGT